MSIQQEIELKNTGKQGHDTRLASSYVDFDSVTNKPKIEKSSGGLTKLLKNLSEIMCRKPKFHISQAVGHPLFLLIFPSLALMYS